MPRRLLPLPGKNRCFFTLSGFHAGYTVGTEKHVNKKAVPNPGKLQQQLAPNAPWFTAGAGRGEVGMNVALTSYG